MPNNFEPLINVVIQRDEGGYVLSNVAGDSGGQTYAGIARNKWPKWAGWALIDAGTDAANPALQHLAYNFYYDNFLGEWFDTSPSINVDVAVKLLSMMVNMGVVEAVKLLQRSVTYLKPGAKLLEDGVAGSLTRYWLNRCPWEDILAELRARAAWFYHETVVHNTADEKFALGWMRRATR